MVERVASCLLTVRASVVCSCCCCCCRLRVLLPWPAADALQGTCIPEALQSAPPQASSAGGVSKGVKKLIEAQGTLAVSATALASVPGLAGATAIAALTSTFHACAVHGDYSIVG
jgi:hypothetical protein